MGGTMSEPLPPHASEPEHRSGALGPVPGRPNPSPEVPPSSPDLPEPFALGGLNPAPDERTALPHGNAERAELPRLQQPRKGRRLVAKPSVPPAPITPE